MKRFSGCWFGPFELRGLLRALRSDSQGERLIGWGTVQQRDGLGISVAMLLLGAVPGVGPLLAMSKTQDFSRFLVLTDRRLLVFRVDHRNPSDPKNAPEHDIPLALLTVGRTVEPHVFEVGVCTDPAETNEEDSGMSRLLGTFEVLRSDGGPPARLRDALGVLATQGDAAAD